MMLVSGTIVLVLLLFQFLQGKRIIKFKGALHRTVHMRVALALLILAIVHGLIGYGFWLSVRLG
jgi:hypothetical protein